MQKTCPKCGKRWNTDDIIADPQVIPIGMIIQNDDPLTGFFFFQHGASNCETSFTVPVQAFDDYLDEPLPTTSLFGAAPCKGHCRKLSQLKTCGRNCRHVPYRRFLLDLMRRKAGKIDIS